MLEVFHNANKEYVNILKYDTFNSTRVFYGYNSTKEQFAVCVVIAWPRLPGA